MASLHDRLGGLAAISAVVNSAVARIAADDRANQKFARSDLAMAPHRRNEHMAGIPAVPDNHMVHSVLLSIPGLWIQPQALEKSTIRRGVPKMSDLAATMEQVIKILILSIDL